MVTVYTLIWSFINCIFLSAVIFLIRKKYRFLINYGTTLPVILFVCCLIRMIFPVEFPQFQYLIEDDTFYAFVMKYVLVIDIYPQIVTVILTLAAAGSLIYAIIIFRQYRQSKRELSDGILGEDEIASQFLSLIDPECKIPVNVSSGASVAILAGVIRPAIYLPVYVADYTETELYYVLLHEYTHWKRKDVWKKTFLNLVCIAFWWNPCAHLLRKEASYFIEINCDRDVTRRLNSDEILDYLLTLQSTLNMIKKQEALYPPHTIALTIARPNTAIEQRFDIILERDRKKSRKPILKPLMIMLILLWLLASYYFLPQSKYAVPRRDVWNNDFVAAYWDTNNAFVKQHKDGHYYFHYRNRSTKIPDEEIEKGYYAVYDIIEYKDNDNFFYKINEIISRFLNNT